MNRLWRHHEILVCDGQSETEINQFWFEPSWWNKKESLLGGAPGRGTTVFVYDGKRELALRHYQRGGMMGGLLGDCYFWNGLEHTRPWRELHLLDELWAQGLPVPRPIAAHCVRIGLFYRADLITERLPGKTLAQWLSESTLDVSQARSVGACIRRFHRAGVFHADLNARNILLNVLGNVYLLDFDKCERRAPGLWQGQNLARLRRSLEKFQRQQMVFHFDDNIWKAILAGYGGN